MNYHKNLKTLTFPKVNMLMINRTAHTHRFSKLNNNPIKIILKKINNMIAKMNIKKESPDYK